MSYQQPYGPRPGDRPQPGYGPQQPGYGQRPAQGPGPRPAYGPDPRRGPAAYPTLPLATAPIPVGIGASTRTSGPSTGAVFLWTAFGIIAALSLGAVLLTALLSVGATGFFLGAALAAVPLLPVGFFYLWLDRFEPEPPALLAATFIWGGAIATLIALIFNDTALTVIAAAANPDVAESATVTIVAPIVEEAAKGFALLMLFLLRRKDVDGVVDGIVYAGMAGLGFAFTENILYIGGAFHSGGSEAAVATFVLRGIFSPFAHPMFTAATGIGIGIAATTRKTWVRVLAPMAGYVVAVILHALWNASAAFGYALVLYFVVQVPLFVGYLVIAVLARRREGRIITTHALAYAQAGWISQADAVMLGSFSSRAKARAWAGRVGGPRAAASMKTFQKLAGELMFQRDRMVRGTAGRDAATNEYAGLLGLAQLRATFPQP